MDLWRYRDDWQPRAGLHDPAGDRSLQVRRQRGLQQARCVAWALFNGTNTTVAIAQTVARYQVPIPDVPTARLANLTQAWVSSRNVALIFDRGKVTIDDEAGELRQLA